MNEPPCLLFSHRAVLVLTRPASVLAPTLQRSGDSGCWLAEPDSGRLRPLCSPNGWWKSIKWAFYWNPVRLGEQQRNPRSPGRVSEEQQSVSYIQNIHTDFLEMAAPQFPPAGVDLLVLLLSQFPVEDRGHAVRVTVPSEGFSLIPLQLASSCTFRPLPASVLSPWQPSALCHNKDASGTWTRGLCRSAQLLFMVPLFCLVLHFGHEITCRIYNSI